MSKKKQKPSVETVTERLGIPFALAAGVFRVTVTGGKNVYVENHRGILEYDEGRIRVNCGRTVLVIAGQRLEVAAVSGHELMIGGNIDSVSFER